MNGWQTLASRCFALVMVGLVAIEFSYCSALQLVGLMASQPTYKPGQAVPKSSQARNTTTGTEVTVVKGERFPPTPAAGQRYVIADVTKHKSGRR